MLFCASQDLLLWDSLGPFLVKHLLKLGAIAMHRIVDSWILMLPLFCS